MCGILLLNGSNAILRMPSSLEKLRHRGPDDQYIWSQDQIALGFTRLAINGVGIEGRQPFQLGNYIGAFNGEIYNYQELIHEHGLSLNSCDTHVILPLFEKFGLRTLDLLDGFYSGVIHQLESSEVYCLRDHIGKKPLFVGRSESEIFITSELKSINNIDWFESLPLGVSQVDLHSGSVAAISGHSKYQAHRKLLELFNRAVAKRMPPKDQPVGVFLSGGLDSSLIASTVSRLRDDVTYFTLGNDEGHDRKSVELLVSELGLKDVRFLPLPEFDLIPELIHSVVYSTESYNPSIVSNGIATYLLAQAAHNAGIKVVLTGEGADELFGGYHLFEENDPWKETRAQLICDMQFTELRRLDLSCMAHSVEPRCPFLDRHIHAFSDQLSFNDLYFDGENKVRLRHSLSSLLPPEILHRKKMSFDVGSGIRGQVVRYLRQNGRSEREELRIIWNQYFDYQESNSYFHSYPTFDSIIDLRGEAHR